MILFLRNKQNRTIAEVECFVKTEDNRKFVELHASVDIDQYSRFLIKSINFDKPEITRNIIADFSEIDELRGWLWEKYQKTEPEEYNNIIKILQKRFKEIANKYDLHYVED